MPFSLIVYGVPEENLSRDLVMGSNLTRLFFGLLSEVNKNFAAGIEKYELAPFTLSPFWGEFTRKKIVSGKEKKGGEVIYLKAQSQFRLRITILEDAIFEPLNQFLAASCLKGSGLSFVEGACLKITHVLVDLPGSDPWCGFATYQEIVDNASSSMKKVALQFITPAAFKTNKTTLPLPVPQLVFQGYLKYWEYFSGIPLSSDLPELLKNFLILEDFRISPATKNGESAGDPGFTGWAKFALKGRHHEKHIRELNLLTDYAYFCGSGINTTKGMGITKRI